MVKFNWVLSTVLLTAIISSLPTGLTKTTRAQTNLSEYEEFTKQNKDNPPPVNPKPPVDRRIGGSSNTPEANPTPPVEPRRGTSRGSNPWAAVFQALPKDEKPPQPPRTGAPRPVGPVCAIAPKTIGSSPEIWNTQPLFVWAGPFKRLELRQVGSDAVLWNYTVKDQQKSVSYEGEALQPGQTYEWRLFLTDREDARPMKTERFRVIDGQKRDRITQQLQSLNEQLKNVSPEDSARQRAQYFAKEQLWSDVLQEAYSVKNPSPTLAGIRQTLPRQLCSSSQ